MKGLPKNWSKPLMFLLGIAVLSWMIWKADPHELWRQLQRMGWGTVAACIGTWAVAYLLNTCSWRAIVKSVSGKSIRYLSMLRYTIAGFSLNYITPMGLLGGEPYRVWAIKPRVGIENATSSVLLYAMMHFCSHFLLWIIGCIVAWMLIVDISISVHIMLVSLFVICSLLLCLFLKGYRSGLVVKFLRILSGLPWIGEKITRWQMSNEDMLINIDLGIASLLKEHSVSFFCALGLELSARLVCCFELQFIGNSIGLTLGFGHCLLIYAFSSLLANLLFFSPLQMGTREGGIAWALMLIGIGADIEILLPLAVVISMATRIREFVWIAVGGLLSSFGRESDNNLIEI